MPVDLHQLIAEVIALGKRSIDKRITFEQKLNAPRAVILGDPSALQNALLNLLLNARDALPRGGTVQFGTEILDVNPVGRESSPTLAVGRHIVLTVSDTGIGIPPDLLGKIFEPFFTTKESGTGMGLAGPLTRAPGSGTGWSSSCCGRRSHGGHGNQTHFGARRISRRAVLKRPGRAQSIQS